MWANTLKKEKFQGPPRREMTIPDIIINKLQDGLQNINIYVEFLDSKVEDEEINRMYLKEKIELIQQEMDKLDDVLVELSKYGKGNPASDGVDRIDSKYLAIAGSKYDPSRSIEE